MGKDGGEGWGREGRIKLPEAAGGENMKGSPFSLKDRSLSHTCLSQRNFSENPVTNSNNPQHLSLTLTHTQKLPLVLSPCLPGSPMGALSSFEAFISLK